MSTRPYYLVEYGELSFTLTIYYNPYHHLVLSSDHLYPWPQPLHVFLGLHLFWLHQPPKQETVTKMACGVCLTWYRSSVGVWMSRVVL